MLNLSFAYYLQKFTLCIDLIKLNPNGPRTAVLTSSHIDPVVHFQKILYPLYPYPPPPILSHSSPTGP